MYTCEKLILQQLEKYKNKKIAFYGASLFLKDFIQNNNLDKYHIIGIIDKNISKEGTFIENYKIFSPQNLLDKIDYIVFTVRNQNQTVYNTLYDLLKNQNIQAKLLPNIFEIPAEIIASNKLYIYDDSGKRTQIDNIPGLKIIWEGYDSIVEISSSTAKLFGNATIICNHDSCVKIGSNCRINNLLLLLRENGTFIMGNSTSIEGAEIVCTRRGKVTIGNDSMLSKGIFIRATDGHLIFDINTKKLINPEKDIKIGNHVWIGQNVTLLKGSCINDNCVIGASSLVNKVFSENNVIIAGNPAKIIKKDIYWER